MRVLITGLFEPAAVHVVRRLGELGYEVYAAEGHRLAYAGFSKYVTRRVSLPNMRYAPREYAEALLRELESGKYDYYFPSYEEIILLSHYRDRVVAAAKTSMMDTETLMALHDKTRLGVLATELGIDSPQTFAPQSLAEADESMASVKLPVVIKMRKTSGAAGFRKVYDRANLKKEYEEVVRANKLAEDDLPMIQELIEGPTTCTLHLCDRGNVIGEVMYQGVRTMPRTGGTTVCRESMADPACQAAAAKIVKRLGFSGFCGFDFVIQEGTGKPFLVDGNCRITPAIAMAYHGGCDMVPAWLEAAAGRAPANLPTTRIGTRTKMGFGDFVWLLESYLGSFKDWSGERRLRKLWWADRRVPDDISSRKDPMPIVMLWVYIFANLWKLIFTDFDSVQLFIFHNQYVEDPRT
ncbi:MAG: ATP-grasp domain-containing protein [Candidatus Bipolaricaulota bacterium]|nr:ATP-grasp domain-containing protein [Candidatus Bipolaricaulota bacterium]